MKKILGVIVSILVLCTSVQAYWLNDYDTPINVCASHILVQDEILAKKLKLEIKSYEDFAQLAKIYSECPSSQNGGYLGCFGRKQMVKEFEKAAFDGNIGEVIGPVKTQFGYHLIWVTRKY